MCSTVGSDINVETVYRAEEIHLNGEIDEAMARDFETEIRRLVFDCDQDQLLIVLDSEGGDMYAALRMVDCMLSLPKDVTVYTCVRSTAFSAAAMLFACGHERYVGTHATIMIHAVRSNLGDDDQRLPDLMCEARETQRLNDVMFEVIRKRTGVSKALISTWKARNVDLYFNVSEALSSGFATHEGACFLETSVVVDYRLRTSRKRKR